MIKHMAFRASTALQYGGAALALHALHLREVAEAQYNTLLFAFVDVEGHKIQRGTGELLEPLSPLAERIHNDAGAVMSNYHSGLFLGDNQLVLGVSASAIGLATAALLKYAHRSQQLREKPKSQCVLPSDGRSLDKSFT